jgi:proteasome lid subunit RPN8/RPN11
VIERVVLPGSLHDRLLEEGSSAFPRECCGLIEGVLEETVARVTTIHPTRNLATDSDRFEIDPAEQIALMKRLRGTGREIIGCYHSHPNGRAEPSARDRAGAFGADFLWLIVAVTSFEGGLDASLRAYEIEPDDVREIAMVPDSPAA